MLASQHWHKRASPAERKSYATKRAEIAEAGAALWNWDPNAGREREE